MRFGGPRPNWNSGSSSKSSSAGAPLAISPRLLAIAMTCLHIKYLSKGGQVQEASFHLLGSPGNVIFHTSKAFHEKSTKVLYFLFLYRIYNYYNN